MHDLIIVGAGSAGLTAGLYAGRFRLDTLLLESLTVGGQIILSATIDNFPGSPAGTSTQELIDRMRQQVSDVGVSILNDSVVRITPDGERFAIATSSQNLSAKSVIIATGAGWKRLGVSGEDQLIGKGVSYCGTCDGPLFRNKDIAVVGGGDKAVEEALFLATYARSVLIIHRRNQLRATRILQEKVFSHPKISFAYDTVVERIIGERKVEAIDVKNVITGQPSRIICQGVFIFVGISPNTGFIKNQLKTDELGFIITDYAQQTSQQGIFACGDCCKKSLYQVINACGEGAVAADSAHKYLLNR